MVLDLSPEQESFLKEIFVIAEISCNHMGDYDVLKQSIDAAFDVGANAVKLQSSTPESLTRNFKRTEFIVNIKDSPWNGRHLYDLYDETCTPVNWPLEFIPKYEKLGKTIFSTPFSPEMVDLLEDKAKPKFYKISSIDWNHIDLIDRCISTGKPVFISMVKPSEQYEVLKRYNWKNIIPMYCISQYPSRSEDMDFNELLYLKSFEIFGFSDHSLTGALSSLAISHGATVIEKHFMLNDSIKSADSHFSLTPDALKNQMSEWKEIVMAIRSRVSKTAIPVGRSLYYDRNIKRGEIIDRNMICVIRPGGVGLSPLELSEIIGKRARINLAKGDPVQKGDFLEVV